MKILIYTLPFLLFMQACNKSNPSSSPNTYDPNKHIRYTIIDNITNQPVDSVGVQLVYGNVFSENKNSDANGKVSFSIPQTWVVNQITMTKQGYCYYVDSPNSVSVVLTQTVNLNRIAYIRFNILNQPPIQGLDKLVIYYPGPTLSSPPPLTFYGAANTSTIVPALKGNLGISTNIFLGSTFISSTQVNTVTISSDTIDVNVNF